MSDRSRVLYGVASFGQSTKLTMAASAYIDPVVDLSRPPTAADLETVFRKPAGRFGRNHVRNYLIFAKGFPHPFEGGLCSAKTGAEWPASTAGRSARVARLNACDFL